MQPVWQLAIRNWRAKPARGILVALVVLLAVALVTLTSLLLAGARNHFEQRMTGWLGSVDVRLRPLVAKAGQTLPRKLLRTLRQNSKVQTAGGQAQVYAQFIFRKHAIIAPLTGLSWPAMGKLHPLQMVRGKLPRRTTQGWNQEIVLDGGLASSLHVKVGQSILIRLTAAKTRRVLVCGLASRSAVKRFLAQPHGYVSMGLLGDIVHGPVGLTQIDIRLKTGVNKKSFVARLQRQLGPAVKIVTAGGSRAAFAKIQQIFNRLTVLTVVPAAIGCGMFIMAIMLIGFAERVRYLGQLRCIGASRGQLAAAVICETAMPASCGILVGIGLAIPMAAAIAFHFRNIFGILPLDTAAMAWGLISGVLATLIGLLLPLGQALRVSPMAAVRVAGAGPLRRRVWPLFVAGALAVTLQRCLWEIPDSRVAVGVYALVGAPLLFFSAFAFGPPLASWLEGTGRGFLGWIWRIEGALLHGAWNRAPYRAGFLIASLLFGTAFFISMRSRGAGLIKSWEFPAHFPDAFVFSPVSPLRQNRLENLAAKVPGIKAATGLTAFWVTRQNNEPAKAAPNENSILFVAVQPRRFSRMVGLQFVRGSAAKSQASLLNGTGLLVATRLRLGAGEIPNSLVLQTLLGPRRFKVAGVVYSRGMSMAAGYMRVGHMFHSMASISVLGTLAESAEYFGIGGANMVLLRVKPGFKGMAVVMGVKAFLGRPRHPTLFSNIFNLKAMQLRGTSVRQMKRRLNAVVRRVMQAMLLLATAVFLTGGIGAGMLVAADIRSRRHELGILFAVGASRGQILRLLLAELSLNLILAILLGSLLGIYMTFMATQVDHRLTGFHSMLIISWMAIPIAAAATIIMAFAGVGLPLLRTFKRPLQMR